MKTRGVPTIEWGDRNGLRGWGISLEIDRERKRPGSGQAILYAAGIALGEEGSIPAS